ncbi:MAG TPA: FMN-binding protein [Sedimentisphaerales bacterium]|nr:FMN-binding protein [Sedimentisphaerales bacterium]
MTVKDGRIQSVRVTSHEEKQFYSALTDTPNQIIAKQGVKGVDAVTGATMTSEAILNATAKALAEGMKAAGR